MNKNKISDHLTHKKKNNKRVVNYYTSRLCIERKSKLYHHVGYLSLLDVVSVVMEEILLILLPSIKATDIKNDSRKIMSRRRQNYDK